MKVLFVYVQTYLQEYFHRRLYVLTAVFLALCIGFNFVLDFENSYIDQYYGSTLRWPMYFVWMSFPFLGVCGLLYALGLNRVWLYSREFWVLFFVGFLVVSLERSFAYQEYFLDDLSYYDRKFLRKTFVKLKPILTTVLPLLVFYYCYEKPRDEQQSWYGLNFKPFDFKPYAFLILLVFVGIGFASFLGDLGRYYPVYQRTGGASFAEQHDLPAWLTLLGYESIYGLSFLGVEFFFRGFLVIGFARVLGGYAVLAMVGPYVFLHFGKPLSECVSSAFGGYLIGILAYYSRHIWGGVVLHVALAWFMEIFAALQKLYND
ncbi:hypothetical protein BFP72_01900 [Reichenbachiella sp. 5M10]|uniref:CPBP family intramembrane metalloprotease n=1 Tax=Reichenbachiella sp. 5M10 TaxID=1889772 RepID=UPI000C14FCEC|nr:CPBP family intramembrane metalloprotease [Reichenbachiella sp. 5M10]PIB34271.1 hypothetical protein BFP72_01900 [Reichenbachiella sp. 5M10]